VSDHPDPDAAGNAEKRQKATGGQASAFAQMVVGGMVGAILLLCGGLAYLEVTDRLEGEQEAVAVLGATETRDTAPPVTVTTQDPAAAWAALLAAAPTTTSSTTTTTTAPPQTTTTTARPAPIAKASAASAGDGVTLELDVVPSAAGQIRAIDSALLARFDDARVLRALHVDFGDGTAQTPEVQPWACNAPDAPDLFDLSLPGHTYGRAGTYVVRATVTTATCSPDDDDWGPETSSQVELTVVVN
jgi:hypothetical protein